MPYQIVASLFEVKANLSKFVRALSRGDTDFVVIQRYGRPVALVISLVNRDKPALEPQTNDDRAMRRRARLKGSGVCRRLNIKPGDPGT